MKDDIGHRWCGWCGNDLPDPPLKNQGGVSQYCNPRCRKDYHNDVARERKRAARERRRVLTERLSADFYSRG